MWIVQILLCLGLLWVTGCTVSDPSECFNSGLFVDVNVVSSSKIDSMDVFVEKNMVCHNDYALLYTKCSNDSFFSRVDDIFGSLDTCELWNTLGCHIGPNESIDSMLFEVNVYGDGEIKKLKFKNTWGGGNIVNIIPEQDTVQWYNYKENPVIPVHEAFESPAESKRGGCFDGYCVAVIPMFLKEFCYDE